MILLVTTIWVTGSARTGTQQAVSKVSEFYLEELAGRRAQVVSEELKNNLAYMENALTILEEPYLESQETLRSFLGKVKRLYGVDKFALVDENGIVIPAWSMKIESELQARSDESLPVSLEDYLAEVQKNLD